MKLRKLFKNKVKLIAENASLNLKIKELEVMIVSLIDSRKKDFGEIKDQFDTIVDLKENELRSSMQSIINKKQNEIERLNKIIDENHEIIQGVKCRNADIHQLEEEVSQRLKMAFDFYNKGCVQLEMITNLFKKHQKEFKYFETKEIPKLQHSTGSKGLIQC